jgi:hypothetical protein
MGKYTKANGKIINITGRAHLFKPMVTDMRVNGKTTFIMALAENTVRMELLMKDNIIMDLSTAKGL